MKRKIYTITILTAIIGLISFSFKTNQKTVCPSALFNYPGGGASGHGAGLSGASWDNVGRTCSYCHSGGSYSPTTVITLLNSSQTPVTQYIPGASYTFQMKVTSASGSPKYGFCIMSAKTGSNANLNNWGASLPTGVANHTVASRNYIEQTSARSATNTTPTSSYTLSIPWTAPTSGTGSVTFYSEAMATNGATTTNGDSPAPPVNLTITESSVLPIKFTKVSAAQNKNNIVVNWATELESNILSYSIENSTDAIHFNTIGSNLSNHNSTSTYSYLHTNPASGKNYYRIAAFDASGNKLISNITECTTSNGTSLSISPNPVKKNLTIDQNTYEGNAYNIVNIKGQIVASGKVTSSRINTTQLTSGIYTLIILHNNGMKESKKFIKD